MSFIKSFFKDLFNRIKEDKKFRIRFIGIAALCVIGITIIVLVAVKLSGGSNEPSDEPVVEITPTPELTATPIPSPTDTPTPTPEPTPTPDLHIGEVRSKLDGGWIKEEIANDRPYAMTLNNIVYANPQSGIGEAKILYEALTEGGITRFLAVFEGLNEDSSCAERLGSVRSARHYFVSIAHEYDAIFIHYGATTYANRKLEELKITDDIEGLKGVNDPAYYRDKTIEAPHNAFASVAGIKKVIENRKIRIQHKDNFEFNHFNILEEDVYPLTNKPVAEQGDEPAGITASYVSLPYHKWMKPYFIYDAEKGVYARYQYDKEHIDYNTGEQLEFKNIIIQIVKESNKDKNGYQEIDFYETEGTGYYISLGQVVPITWKKSESSQFMMYYDENGNTLSVNPGKTFISIFPDYRENLITFNESN